MRIQRFALPGAHISLRALLNPQGDSISEYINNELGEPSDKQKLVVSCASQEYFKAVRSKVLRDDVKVIVCEFPGPSVYAKRARGMMCRYIIENEIETEEGLEAFAGFGDDAYTYSSAQSSDGRKVFLRGGGSKRTGSNAKQKGAKRQKK